MAINSFADRTLYKTITEAVSFGCFIAFFMQGIQDEELALQPVLTSNIHQRPPGHHGRKRTRSALRRRHSIWSERQRDPVVSSNWETWRRAKSPRRVSTSNRSNGKHPGRSVGKMRRIPLHVLMAWMANSATGLKQDQVSDTNIKRSEQSARGGSPPPPSPAKSDPLYNLGEENYNNLISNIESELRKYLPDRDCLAPEYFRIEQLKYYNGKIDIDGLLTSTNAKLEEIYPAVWDLYSSHKQKVMDIYLEKLKQIVFDQIQNDPAIGEMVILIQSRKRYVVIEDPGKFYDNESSQEEAEKTSKECYEKLLTMARTKADSEDGTISIVPSDFHIFRALKGSLYNRLRKVAEDSTKTYLFGAKYMRNTVQFISRNHTDDSSANQDNTFWPVHL